MAVGWRGEWPQGEHAASPSRRPPGRVRSPLASPPPTSSRMHSSPPAADSGTAFRSRMVGGNEDRVTPPPRQCSTPPSPPLLWRRRREAHQPAIPAAAFSPKPPSTLPATVAAGGADGSTVAARVRGCQRGQGAGAEGGLSPPTGRKGGGIQIQCLSRLHTSAAHLERVSDVWDAAAPPPAWRSGASGAGGGGRQSPRLSTCTPRLKG